MTLGEHVAPSDEAISLERVGEQVVYEGDRRLARRRYASPDGDVTFDIVLDGPGTAVLALTDDGHVVLTRQFRPGAERVVWDLPGGFVDEGETPAEAAARELREETGYEAAEVAVVAALYPSAYSTEKRHAVVARGCRRTAPPATDEDERVEVRLVSVDELRRIARAGDLTAVDAAYLALDHAGLL
jgi:ADP-ribose pyrophosphatase